MSIIFFYYATPCCKFYTPKKDPQRKNVIVTSTLHMTRAIVITFLFTGLPWLGAGVPKPGGGGWGIYPPNNLTVSPQQFEYGLHLHPLQ